VYNLNESTRTSIYSPHTQRQTETLPRAARPSRLTPAHARQAHHARHRSPPDPPRVVITVAYYTHGPYGAGPIGYEPRSRSCAPQNGRK
jgi:hypothetical protein